MQPKYYAVEDMLEMIEESNRAICERIMSDNLKLFITAPGASHNHQIWRGGYIDHVKECMNLAIVLYDVFSSLRPLHFSLPDALLVLFLHDLEKPWKYSLSKEGELVDKEMTKEDRAEFRNKKLEEYGIRLTAEQENAMKYVEGEWKDYSNKYRVQGELAAFCHVCDVISARIWHNYPVSKLDPWMPALRDGETVDL